MVRRTALALAVVLVVGVLPATAETVDSPAVTAPEILDHIKALASDDMEGREAGSAGARKASEYLAAAFVKLGIPGAGPGGEYFQSVPIPSFAAHDSCALVVSTGGDAVAHRVSESFVPFLFSAEKEITAPVAFAGYGIVAPKLSWNDFDGVDVRGKIALIFRHEPHEGEDRGRAFRRAGHSSFSRKIRNAVSRGAVGVILVEDPSHPEPESLPRVLWGRRTSVPAVFAKQSVAASILGQADLTSLQRALDSGKLETVTVESTVRLAVKIDRTPKPGRNVVAVLRGTDPELADECVVVGAHYDHMGRGRFGGPIGGGEIHNGADDNASGTAAVLEIAESLLEEENRPRRSVLFALFTGEERGLVGSRHYVEHPLHPIAKTVAMLNLDMVGRSQKGSVFIGGVGTSPEFQNMLEPLVAREKLKARYGYGGAAPSDNTPFYRAGIPTLFFFTGIHRDYHRPTDDWEKINADGAARVTRVAADAIRAIANAPERPAYRRTGRAYLGVMPGRGGEGALVTRVMNGTPAFAAGLKNGDRIVKANDVKIWSWRELRSLLGKARPGDELVSEVARGEDVVTLRLILGER